MSSIPPYVPPSVTAAGLTVSTYPSILQDNLQAFLNIFGTDQNVEPDSAIYQLLSILSLKQSDVNLAAQLAYNQSSPQTAVGAGLDRVLKMNGLAREPFGYSTVTLTLTGDNGTVVTNGFAQDGSGNLWALPSPTIIVVGTVDAIATCTTPGNIAANPGDITIIATPISGWLTVNNAGAAVAGTPVESDSEARARQAISVALPALTPLASTVATILATSGVTRIAPGYATPGGPGSSIENPTGATDSWGNPAHSISMVVEGGTDLAVATSIYIKKTIGCFTNGTTTVPVVDPDTGFTEDISFFRPTYVEVFILSTVHGYSTVPTAATLLTIRNVLVAYLNELAIGETVSMAALIFEAMSVNASITGPGFGVQTLKIGSLTAATTATLNSTNVIVVASATGIVNGQLVVATGIPVGTTVSGTSGTSITLSAAATVTDSGVAIKFSTVTAADLAMPDYHTVAQGFLVDVSVVAV